jgi:hypothetical protein
MTTRVGDIRAQIEQKIGQTDIALEGETGGMYLAARLVKQKIAATSKGMTSSRSSETLPTKQKQFTTSNKPSRSSRPPHSPSKTSRSRNNNGPSNHSTYGDKGSTEFSVTSRTTCGSDTEYSSGEFKPTTSSSSPMRHPAKDRVATKRASICQKRFVDIPQSIDEEKEEIVGCTIVMCDINALEGSMWIMNLDNDEEVGSNFSPRRGSIVSRSNNMDESEQSINSRGSTLSRSSPQIRSLPRDVDFDSDDSSMSDDDSAGLAKHRQQQRVRKPLPKPRYW